MKENIEILIVTRSAALQQGLGALLESLPNITSVKAVSELTKAYNWIAVDQPRVVLLDVGMLENTIKTALEKIQLISPKTQRVLLMDDVEKVNLVPKYAEAILIKGISPSALTSIVTNLLSKKGAEHEHSDSNE